jgi:hypothetical protein
LLAAAATAAGQGAPTPVAGRATSVVRGWKLEGRVLDQRRFPAAGIRVWPPYRDRDPVTAVTDGRGRYALDRGDIRPDKVAYRVILAWDGKQRAGSTLAETTREV